VFALLEVREKKKIGRRRERVVVVTEAVCIYELNDD